MAKRKFEIGVSTRYAGSKDTTIFEVDEEDLEGVEGSIDDYVWDELGGKEAAFEMVEMWMKEIK